MKATVLALIASLVALGGCGGMFDTGLPGPSTTYTPPQNEKPVSVHAATVSVVDVGRSSDLGSEADVYTRLLDAADVLAAESPDVIALHGAPTTSDVARLLDELSRRGLAYDEASRYAGHAVVLVRSDAGIEVVHASAGGYVTGHGGWAFADLVRGETELRVVAAVFETSDTNERLLQVTELLYGPAYADAPIVLTVDLGSEDADEASDVQHVLAGAGFVEVPSAAVDGDSAPAVLYR